MTKLKPLSFCHKDTIKMLSPQVSSLICKSVNILQLKFSQLVQSWTFELLETRKQKFVYKKRGNIILSLLLCYISIVQMVCWIFIDF